ncbi:type II toxin-antitoxin system RelE/ParE family toxin [Zoogloea sp. LCSB751]|uniref:type II toxin-antitoxin system RelE family toxin n=1 Tax=Zoogloea sp. LCSB751 TaxID=1965277 RepID=UPI0009A4A89A|nr:type II toxin-antitoxin system RelE/ParE family toxin [Zoogloea sp. LCSB751]
MNYKLGFIDEALAEWRELDDSVRARFKTLLAERLKKPPEPAAKLKGHPDRYEIALRRGGHRLVYEVRGQQLVVVIVDGKRDRNAVFKAGADAAQRNADVRL